MELGTVVEGKVTGITKFGAFVALPGGKTGLVHISEIASTFVNDIKNHLTEGQMVKVKVISVDDAGRINLSIKKAAEPVPVVKPFEPKEFKDNRSKVTKEPATFEDKLKRFMADSDSKMSDLKQYNDKKRRTRKG